MNTITKNRLFLPLLALSTLALTLKTHSNVFTTHAAAATQEKTESANIETQTAPREVAALLRRFKAAPHHGHQLEIGRELVRLGDKSVLGELALLLRSPSRIERCNAAFVLARLSDDRGFPALLAELNDRAPRMIVDEGSFAINADRSRRSTATVSQDRYYAAHVLGLLKDKRALPALIALLDDKDLDYQAAFVLGQLDDKRAVPALRRKRAQLQLASKNKRTRSSNRHALFAVSSALARLGDTQGMTELIGYLRGEDWLWRRHSVEMLADFSSHKAVPLVTPMLKDPSERVRISAAQTLGKLGDVRAVPALNVAQTPDDAKISWRTVALAHAANRAISAIWRRHGIIGMEMRNGVITKYVYARNQKPLRALPIN